MNLKTLLSTLLIVLFSLIVAVSTVTAAYKSLVATDNSLATVTTSIDTNSYYDTMNNGMIAKKSVMATKNALDLSYANMIKDLHAKNTSDYSYMNYRFDGVGLDYYTKHDEITTKKMYDHLIALSQKHRDGYTNMVWTGTIEYIYKDCTIVSYNGVEVIHSLIDNKYYYSALDKHNTQSVVMAWKY
ncbi:MAG TPA: hypothetical protein VK190_03305 [Pseudoneobacillus sp.]|jgi:hypothetical protein|nr:hypothetical protein [Pseudoneobacillus sp.]